MFSLSQYDQSCLAQHPEYTRLFQHQDVLNTLAWQQELCHEHLRLPASSSPGAHSMLEYEARIGCMQGTHFDSSIAQSDFQCLLHLFSSSKWFTKMDTDVVMTQDMYYTSDKCHEGSCRTRIRYFKNNKPFEMEHVWKRKLSSVTVESRVPQLSTKEFAIRIDLNQEIPIVFAPSSGTNPIQIQLQDTQVVKIEKVRFKWSEVFEYQSPETGLVWRYHFHRVLEGRTKCEAEQKFRQLNRFVRYECECECMNFLSVFHSNFTISMTPIVYLFESLLVKLNDWVQLFLQKGEKDNKSMNMYVCVQARLFVEHVKQLYNRFFV